MSSRQADEWYPLKVARVADNRSKIEATSLDNGIAIGQTDLIRMVCKECSDQSVCPSNSVYPSGVVSTAENSSDTTVSMNVHAMGSSE